PLKACARFLWLGIGLRRGGKQEEDEAGDEPADRREGDEDRPAAAEEIAHDDRSSSANGSCAASSKRGRLRASEIQPITPRKVSKETTVTAMRRSLMSIRGSLLHGGAEHLQVGDERIDLALATH